MAAGRQYCSGPKEWREESLVWGWGGLKLELRVASWSHVHARMHDGQDLPSYGSIGLELLGPRPGPKIFRIHCCRPWPETILTNCCNYKHES